MYSFTLSISLFYLGSADVTLASETQLLATGTYSGNKLECDLDIPDVSKAMWLCPSFNQIHLLNCRNITFYERAPMPVENTLIFTTSGKFISRRQNTLICNLLSKMDYFYCPSHTHKITFILLNRYILIPSAAASKEISFLNCFMYF